MAEDAAAAVDYDPFGAAEDKELPTTPAQREMVRLARAHPESACAFHEAVVIRLSGTVDREALASSLQSLADFHEALRGRIGAGGERLLIAPSLVLPVAHSDFSALERTARERALAGLLAADAGLPFDLEAGPLVRSNVVRLGEAEHVVVLSVHGVVCDGWSLDVLLYDLGRLYSAFVGDAALPTPPAHGISDHLAHRASAEFAARAASSRDFWRQALADDPTGPGRRVAAEALHHASRAIRPELVDRARAFARSSGLSFFAVLLSAAACCLRRQDEDRALTFAVPVAGHPEMGMEDCVGQLASTVPVRVGSSADGSFRRLVEDVNRAVLDARENASVDLGEIATDLGLPSGFALADAVFTHVQKYAPARLRFGDCTVDYSFNRRSTDVVPLGFTVLDSGAGLDVAAFAAAGRGDAAWLEGRLADLERTLARGCGDSDGGVDG